MRRCRSWSQGGVGHREMDAVMFYGSRTYMVQVSDDSMEPRFSGGDYLYVDPDVAVEPGRIVVFRESRESAAAFRYLVEEDGRLLLRAANPAWPDRVLNGESEAMICGVVVFSGCEV